MHCGAAMQMVRFLSDRTGGREDRATYVELDASVCDEVVDLIVSVRAALAEGRQEELRQMAHPTALRHEAARLARRLGMEAAARFWPEATADVEAVRLVSEGVAEVYEQIHHPSAAMSWRLLSTVEYVKGHWRLTATRDATDERVTAVLLRGAPPDADTNAELWTRRWTAEYGATARLTMKNGEGTLEHPTEGWTAIVRMGSGGGLARALGASGTSLELMQKQPAATVVSLVPVLEARARTEQLRWISRAVAAFGARDASSVWIPSAAKALPFSSWRSAMEGPLELPALSALWLRTQRQRGAWVTRGMGSLMLPEVEIWCAGMSVATVRALLREAAGRLLAHHQERVNRRLDACAPAVLGIAPRLYQPTELGPVPLPVTRLETALELGDSFVVGEVESVLGLGRQGPRTGDSYGRWGAMALRSEGAWWVEAA